MKSTLAVRDAIGSARVWARLHMEDAILRFFAGGVYWGESHFRDKDEVKLHCGTARQRRYDRERKLWGTTSLGAVQSLLETGLWWPTGIEHFWKVAFTNHLANLIEERAAEVSGKAERASAAKRARSTTEVVSKEEQRKLQLLREVLPCSPEEVAALAKLGVSPRTVEVSIELITLSDGRSLGPQTGISASARVLRLFHFETNAARFGGPSVDERHRKLVGILAQHALESGGVEENTTSKVPAFHRAPQPERRAEDVISNAPINNVDRSRIAKPHSAPSAIATAECRKCFTRVHVQFMCCGCYGEEHQEAWFHCDKCERLVNPQTDACAHCV